MISVGTLRSLGRRLPKPVERSVRRTTYALMPVRHRSTSSTVFHCCTWKTASQWVRGILSDPRIYAWSGLRAQPMSLPRWSALSNDNTALVPSGRIYTPVYASRTSISVHMAQPGNKAFFVYRDPRDLLVSRYYSRLSAHPATPGITERRESLASLSKEDGLLTVLEDFSTVVDIVDDWLSTAADDDACQLLRYEDLTGPDASQHWRSLFNHLDIALPDKTLLKLLNTYSFERITSGRAKGVEDASHKYRKGVAGDWVNHWSDAVEQDMHRRFGDLAVRWGYDG